jgi:hypothetical protein
VPEVRVPGLDEGPVAFLDQDVAYGREAVGKAFENAQRPGAQVQSEKRSETGVAEFDTP